MCMEKVIFTVDNRGVGTGYKAINTCFIDKFKNGFRIGKNYYNWSKNWRNASNSDDKILPVNYRCGFHIFLTKKAAKEYALPLDEYIVKVEYKNILAFGRNFTKDRTAQCIIAKTMRIIEVLE